MGVTESKNWPCGHIDHKWNVARGGPFTICDQDGEANALGDLTNGQYCKIKTQYTMHSNYEWAYSSDEGWIYYDLFSSNEKQLWKLHKSGDWLAFECTKWPGWFLGTSGSWQATEGRKVWWKAHD